ncbi:MAG: aspartyl protease family protein [Bacteroidetes bacterium]|nr:aspartyl protease family protein [Bacteroidota bacterium]
MGMFQKRVKVFNPIDNNKFFEENFWIDTGALYTLIPQNMLEKIDFEPEGTKNLIFANGKTDRKLLPISKFEIEGLPDRITCPVIAGSTGSLYLLGATALENFGVEADPINKELKPIFAIIGGFRGSI